MTDDLLWVPSPTITVRQTVNPTKDDADTPGWLEVSQQWQRREVGREPVGFQAPEEEA